MENGVALARKLLLKTQSVCFSHNPLTKTFNTMSYRFITSALVLFVLCVSSLQADVVSTNYSVTNKDPQTLQISSETGDARSLAGLFNAYFKNELAQSGASGYATSQDLYNDRGVKAVISDWSVTDGAQIVSAFKSADYGHTLNLLNMTSGVAVDSATFRGYMQDNVMTKATTTIDVDPGLYNFSLDVWKPKGDKVVTWWGNVIEDQRAIPGEDLWSLHGEDPNQNEDGLIHMVAFDVTDLIRLMHGVDIESAYMFGFEDMLAVGHTPDFDYQDLALVMINVKPNVTPEPSTALIFLIGGAVSAAAYRRRKK